ncbi:uncharacterized protein [Macrobrachium rosenbergii]|uniref:uncharacterized protein n=1 Tax=Macrobrachium rosenbergii TaxID=79674 RepID=UPI0034D49162
MSEVSPKKRRKMWYKPAFKAEWLQEPEFKDWLKRDSTNGNNSYCICCGISIKNANKSMSLAHKNTDKHKRNFESVKSSVAITSFLKKKAEPESPKIAKAEALFAGFSEHHVPFAHVTSHQAIHQARDEWMSDVNLNVFK